MTEKVYKKAANTVLAKKYLLKEAPDKYEINFMILKRYTVKNDPNEICHQNANLQVMLIDQDKYFQIF